MQHANCFRCDGISLRYPSTIWDTSSGYPPIQQHHTSLVALIGQVHLHDVLSSAGLHTLVPVYRASIGIGFTYAVIARGHYSSRPTISAIQLFGLPRQINQLTHAVLHIVRYGGIRQQSSIRPRIQLRFSAVIHAGEIIVIAHPAVCLVIVVIDIIHNAPQRACRNTTGPRVLLALGHNPGNRDRLMIDEAGASRIFHERPACTSGQFGVGGGDNSRGGLHEADTHGGENLALTGVQQVFTAVGGRIAVNLVRHLSAHVAVGKRTVAQQVRGVLLAGIHVIVHSHIGGVELRRLHSGKFDLRTADGGRISNDLQRTGMSTLGGLVVAGGGGHIVIHQHRPTVPGAHGQIPLHARRVGVLQVFQQPQVFQVGGHNGVHQCHAENALVGTDSLLSGGVQGRGVDHGIGIAGNVQRVLVGKTVVASHGKHALQDGQQGVLVNVIPVVGNLRGDVFHVVCAGDVVGEIAFLPRLSAAHNDHGLGIGLRAGVGDVGAAVIVHGFAVQQAIQGDGGEIAARLSAKHRPQVVSGAEHACLNKRVLLYAGHTVNVTAEYLAVENFGIKYAHSNHPFSVLIMSESRA
nr:MAG TPA: hypothetical protein [Caudoviricetes sp.]